MQTPTRVTSCVARGLRSRFIIIMSLFVLSTLNYGSRKIMTRGELDTLPYAKQFADPSYLPGEWYLNRSGSPRRPFQILLYPLVKLLPLTKAAVVARVLGYLFVSIGLGLIARRAGLNAVSACVAIGAYLWLGHQALLPGSNSILKRPEGLVAGYGLLFLSIHALMYERVRLAAAYAGLATTFHVLVGGWGSLALGLTVLSQRTGTLRQRITSLGVWCVTGCVGIYYALAFLWEPETGDLGFDVGRIIVYFRNPHHLDPLSWSWPWDVVVWAFVLLGVILTQSLPGVRRRAVTLVARVTLWSLLPALCGLLVVRFSFAHKFLSLYPFRVGSTWLTLFGLIIGMSIVVRCLRRRFITSAVRRVLLLGAACFFFWLAGQRFVTGWESLRRYPEGAAERTVSRTDGLYDVCHWIRDNTEPGALLLASPHIKSVSYLSRRPVVVRFQNDPSKRADVAEWYRRILDFNDGADPRQRGYDASKEIDLRFRRLPASAYLELARKYGAAYLMLKRRDEVQGLRRIYKKGPWTVFDMRDTDMNGGG